jgi:glutamine amidotransferase
MIGIVNYGSGNVRAIGNIYDILRIEYKVIDNPSDLQDVERLILPGVGAFDETMTKLNNSGFREVMEELVLVEKMPVLGICVGMQILSNGSDEGELPGLGWIPGKVKKFDKTWLNHKPKLPHLGWNSIEIRKPSLLLNEVDQEEGFYFIHTYYFECEDQSDVLTKTFYGIEFASSVNHENIYGTQFHPEKSHMNGITLLKNFAIL